MPGNVPERQEICLEWSERRVALGSDEERATERGRVSTLCDRQWARSPGRRAEAGPHGTCAKPCA